jgi:hypothetical protein
VKNIFVFLLVMTEKTMLKNPPRYSKHLVPSEKHGRTRALVLPHAAFSYTRNVFTKTLESSRIDASSIVILAAMRIIINQVQVMVLPTRSIHSRLYQDSLKMMHCSNKNIPGVSSGKACNPFCNYFRNPFPTKGYRLLS